MHYYRFNIAEWYLHTAHLEPEEEAIYFRLVNHYYETESPFPVEKLPKLFRRLRLSKYESIANELLEEFFELKGESWHHKKCDSLIEDYLSGQVSQEQKKANEKERQRRHREERSKLFEELKTYGKNFPYDTTTKQLRKELSRVTGSDKTVTVTDSVTHETAIITNQELLTTNYELEMVEASDSDEPQPIGKLLTNKKGEFFFVYAADMELWKEAYPAVNIGQEMKRIAVWLDANPTKRKTSGGMKRFITTWLGKAQDTPRINKPIDKHNIEGTDFGKAGDI